MILSLPQLESARADYTEVWAPRPVLPLIRFADHTRAIIDTGIELMGVVEGASVGELARFDSIYSWYGAARPEFREAVRHFPFTFFPALPIAAHAIPHIPVPPAPLENFAAIHPFSGSVKKNWPLEKFRKVARGLDLPVRWSAGPEEILEDAARFDNLYGLACWLSTARVYIGNDSGISHLAAAAGTPVVAIFVTTDPAVWAPRGPRVTALVNPTVDQVIAAVGDIRR